MCEFFEELAIWEIYLSKVFADCDFLTGNLIFHITIVKAWRHVKSRLTIFSRTYNITFMLNGISVHEYMY